MNTANKCPECGARLPPNAPEGLCPRCLMEMNLATPTLINDDGSITRVKFETPRLEEIVSLFPQLEGIELLGQGGMGVVYKARQKELDRVVALKILPKEIGQTAGFAERFAREARALGKLNHPNIVTLYEFGHVDMVDGEPLYYFLMEYVDGLNLRRLLNNGRIEAREALSIVPQICDALQYAHDEGIVHRDIKPENILLDRRGNVKVADFGLAKIVEEKRFVVPPSGGSVAEQEGRLKAELQTSAEQQTVPGKIMGTPKYMSPEQVKAPGEVDHRADIYALGVVFYQMLTGEMPEDQLMPPSKKVKIDVRLDEVVLRALEQKPDLRYQHASVLKTEVETIVADVLRPEDGDREAEGRATVLSEESRFSRLAIWGAVWACFVLGVLPMFIQHQAPLPAGEYTGPAWWQILLMILLIPTGLTAPFGTTVLGWVSVSKIRRSAGKLYGLGLAVFDGLLFPLLALDGLMVWVWMAAVRVFVDFYANPAMQHRPNVDPAFSTKLANLFADHYVIPIIAAIFTALVVDLLIIRRVWRSVKIPLTNGAQSEEHSPDLRTQQAGALKPEETAADVTSSAVDGQKSAGGFAESELKPFPLLSLIISELFFIGFFLPLLIGLLRIALHPSKLEILAVCGVLGFLNFYVVKKASNEAQRLILQIATVINIVMWIAVVCLSLLFINAMAHETGGWNPALAEAYFTVVSMLGTLVLPFCACRMFSALRCKQQTESWARIYRPAVIATAVVLIGIALFVLINANKTVTRVEFTNTGAEWIKVTSRKIGTLTIIPQNGTSYLEGVAEFQIKDAQIEIKRRISVANRGTNNLIVAYTDDRGVDRKLILGQHGTGWFSRARPIRIGDVVMSVGHKGNRSDQRSELESLAASKTLPRNSGSPSPESVENQVPTVTLQHVERVGGAGMKYNWRVSLPKPVKLCRHSFWLGPDGQLEGYWGSVDGVANDPGTIDFALSVNPDGKRLEYTMWQENASSSAKDLTIPDADETLTWKLSTIESLDNSYTPLWKREFLKEGKVVKTLLYAVRIVGEDEDHTEAQTPDLSGISDYAAKMIADQNIPKSGLHPPESSKRFAWTLNEEVPVDLLDYDGVLFVDGIRFSEQEGLLSASARGRLTSWPKGTWLVTVSLLDAQESILKEGYLRFENSGIIMGVAEIEDWTRELTFGSAKALSSDITHFRITVERLPADSAKELRVKQAEEKLKLVDQQYNAGRISLEQLLAAQCEAEVAKAELAGDSAKVAEVRLAYARKQLALVEARFEAGLIGSDKLLEAQCEVDVLKAELAGDSAKVAEVRLDYANKQLAHVEDRFEAGIIGSDKLQEARLEVERRELEVSIQRVPLSQTTPDVFAAQPSLQFRWVAADEESGSPVDVLLDPKGPAEKATLRVLREVVMDHNDVASAEVVENEGVEKSILLTLTDSGKRIFAEATANNIGRRLAICWDGRIVSAPTVMDTIYGGRVSITGGFSDEEIRQLLHILNSADANSATGQTAVFLGEGLRYIGEWVALDQYAFPGGDLKLRIEKGGRALLYGGSVQQRITWTLSTDELLLHTENGDRTVRVGEDGLLKWCKDGVTTLEFKRAVFVENQPSPIIEEDVARQLEARLTAAKSISSFSERDKVLTDIAVSAGRYRNLPIALTALRRISSFTSRDKAASRCADQFIACGMSAEATQVANTISSFTTRDDVLARIAQGSVDPENSDTKIKEAQKMVSNLSSAIDLFELEVGRYPTEQEGIDALIRAAEIAGWKGPYVKPTDGFVDPWGTRLKFTSSPSLKSFRILSAGPDKRFETNDDIGEGRDESGKAVRIGFESGSPVQAKSVQEFHFSTDGSGHVGDMQKQMEDVQNQMERVMNSGAMQKQMKNMQKQMESMMESMGSQ